MPAASSASGETRGEATGKARIGGLHGNGCALQRIAPARHAPFDVNTAVGEAIKATYYPLFTVFLEQGSRHTL
jgi:hypothetical protein